MIAIGRRVYGLGAVALGIVELRYGAFSADWLPAPAHDPAFALLACATAGVLIAAGLALQAPRMGMIAALALAAVFAGWMLVLEAPPTLATPGIWGVWQAIAESTVMAVGGVLAGILASGVGGARAAAAARIARWIFGVCLLIFGGSHFVYAKLTASLVPAWLPPSQLFWACATGVAQIAAGLAMLTGIEARRAAILLTVMYASFGVLVHVPSVVADPSSHDNWAENAINLLLLGAAWSLADWLACAPAREELPRRPPHPSGV